MKAPKLPPIPKPRPKLALIQATVDAELLAKARAKRIKDRISWRDIIEWGLKAYLDQ